MIGRTLSHFRITSETVSRTRECVFGVWPECAIGERLELFVVMAAELRVTVEEL